MASVANRLEVWQPSAQPLVELSIAYTFIFAYPIFAYPASKSTATLCCARVVIWAVLILDYAIHSHLAENKTKFLKKAWLALIYEVVPNFRPIRARRAGVFLRRASTRPCELRMMIIPWILVATTALMMISVACALLDVEHFAGVNIHSFADALWWARVTVRTFGYGDKFPVINEGRLLAVVLIIFALGLISSLTDSFASWIL